MSQIPNKEIKTAPGTEEFINIKKIISGKNPRLARLLPSFIINYLNRIIHVDEVNATVAKNRHLKNLDFIEAVLDDFGIDVKTSGEENIPLSGRYLVASNHPFGGPDGLALMNSVGKRRKDLKFIVNDLLLNLDNMKELFIPVNKHGSNTKDMIRLQDSVYASDDIVLTFPFGLVSRRHDGIIEDLEWKKSFLTKARQHKRDIIPTFINGRNSNFFYNLSAFRKFLGIRVNVEMLYLPDEFFKQKKNDVVIYFGKPIPWQMFDDRFSDAGWAEKLRKFVYTLATPGHPEFDPSLF